MFSQTFLFVKLSFLMRILTKTFIFYLLCRPICFDSEVEADILAELLR